MQMIFRLVVLAYSIFTFGFAGEGGNQGNHLRRKHMTSKKNNLGLKCN